MDNFLKGALKRVQTFGEEATKVASSAASSGLSYAKDTAAHMHKEYNKPVITRASFSRIPGVTLPRLGHALCVVNGRAYIFGGEISESRMASNEMHIVILPSSGVLEADYKVVAAKPREAGGALPMPRKGAGMVAVGDLIYVFGGQLEDGAAEEKGRVWVFDTAKNVWFFLAAASTLAPSLRYGHALAAADMPAPLETDTRKVEFTLQFNTKVPDPVADMPEPPARDSWGTLFVYGGLLAERDHERDGILFDAWSFDIRTRTWNALPAPRGPGLLGPSLAVSGEKLCLFGGRGGGEVQVLDVAGLWEFSRKTALGAMAQASLVSQWRSHSSEGPDERSRAALVPILGHGPHTLLLLGGETVMKASPSEKGKEPKEAEKYTDLVYHDDVWVYKLDTHANIMEATRHDMGKVTEAANWTEAQTQVLDIYGDVMETGVGMPSFGKRTGFAYAKGSEVEGAMMVAWGGRNAQGKVLEDGWMINIE